MEESIVFGPEIPDRELDKEVSKIDDRLADVDTSISPEMDTGGVGGGGLDAAEDIGGGGGMGGGGKLGAIAGATGGMASTLKSRLPSPVPGITASSIMPVALAGAAGIGMLSAMHSASAKLQAVTGMFGTAMNLFFRPFGNFLGEALRPMAKDMIDFASDFSDLAKSDGLSVAIASLAPTAATAIGNAFKDIISGEGSIGDIVLTGSAVAIVGTLISAIGWPTIGAGTLLGAASWPSIGAAGVVGAISWPVIGAAVITGAIGWQDVTSGDITGAIGWGTVTGALVAAGLGFGTVTGGAIVGGLSFGIITGSMILNEMTESDVPPAKQPQLPPKSTQAPDEQSDFLKRLDLTGGGHVDESGQVVLDEDNELDLSGLETREARAELPVDGSQSSDVSNGTDTSGGNTGSGTGEVEDKIDETNRELRRMRTVLDNQSITIDGEEFGRLTSETRNSSTFDSDPTL